MWQLQRMLDKNRSTAFAGELFESSSRSLILAIAGVYVAWHLFASASWPSDVGKQTWLMNTLR